MKNEEIKNKMRECAADIWRALNSPGSSSFSAQLYRLMMRSQAHQLAAIEKGFPIETQVFREWLEVRSDFSGKWFRRMGINPINGLDVRIG